MLHAYLIPIFVVAVYLACVDAGGSVAAERASPRASLIEDPHSMSLASGSARAPSASRFEDIDNNDGELSSPEGEIELSEIDAAAEQDFSRVVVIGSCQNIVDYMGANPVAASLSLSGTLKDILLAAFHRAANEGNSACCKQLANSFDFLEPKLTQCQKSPVVKFDIGLNNRGEIQYWLRADPNLEPEEYFKDASIGNVEHPTAEEREIPSRVPESLLVREEEYFMRFLSKSRPQGVVDIPYHGVDAPHTLRYIMIVPQSEPAIISGTCRRIMEYFSNIPKWRPFFISSSLHGYLHRALRIATYEDPECAKKLSDISDSLKLRYESWEKSTKYGQLQLIFFAIGRNSLDEVQFLLQHGADLEAVDDDLRIPLSLAANGGVSFDIFKAILDKMRKYGLEVNVPDKYGKTPLSYAIMSECRDKVLLLANEKNFLVQIDVDAGWSSDVVTAKSHYVELRHPDFKVSKKVEEAMRQRRDAFMERAAFELAILYGRYQIADLLVLNEKGGDMIGVLMHLPDAIKSAIIRPSVNNPAAIGWHAPLLLEVAISAYGAQVFSANFSPEEWILIQMWSEFYNNEHPVDHASLSVLDELVARVLKKHGIQRTVKQPVRRTGIYGRIAAW